MSSLYLPAHSLDSGRRVLLVQDLDETFRAFEIAIDYFLTLLGALGRVCGTRLANWPAARGAETDNENRHVSHDTRLPF
jgi:hypothetical protein